MKAWLLGRNEMVDQGAVPHTFYTDQSGNPEGRDPPPRQAEVSWQRLLRQQLRDPDGQEWEVLLVPGAHQGSPGCRGAH